VFMYEQVLQGKIGDDELVTSRTDRRRNDSRILVMKRGL